MAASEATLCMSCQSQPSGMVLVHPTAGAERGAWKDVGYSWRCSILNTSKNYNEVHDP